jgi:hypothetical protein
MEPLEIIAQQHERIKQLEAREEQTAVDSALGGALDASGLNLHQGAREHLGKLLGAKLAVVGDANGNRVVMAPGGAPVNDWVKAQLGGEYGHFVRGGSSAAAAAGPQLPAVEPRNLSEAVMLTVQAQAGARKTGGDPSRDITQGFGLRPKR